jgi:hypothetical protein
LTIAPLAPSSALKARLMELTVWPVTLGGAPPLATWTTNCVRLRTCLM